MLLHPPKESEADETYFSVVEAARLAKMSPARLKRWVTIGAATPTQRVVTDENEIIASGFTLTDVGYLHLLRHFVDRGESLENAISILQHFIGRFGPPGDKWRNAFVGIGGPAQPTLIAFAPDPYLATLPIPGIEGAGQRYFDLLGELMIEGVTLESLLVPQRFREFIEINPKKEGGHPVIRGTRIPTAAIREIARNFGISSVRSDYFAHVPEDALQPAIDFEEYLDAA